MGDSNKNRPVKYQVFQPRKPAREFKVSLSKDSKYWLFHDTTTWFIPCNYLEAIRQNKTWAETETKFPTPLSSDENSGGENDRAN